ncbi:M-phase inducer phosphatase-like isoform X1 [Branchiostoma floridae]|uniref:M-phase inducer phosphatase n=1 Tax=Branchiostoma floridae TaxID=7739 RepID=A0A9J7KLL8_BRAFL|nr:M-phase inducer phosphatase-like isoform X1 [Branchiostoma floridae]
MASPPVTDARTTDKEVTNACGDCHEAQQVDVCTDLPTESDKRGLFLELDLALPINGGGSTAKLSVDHTSDIRPELVVSPMSDLAMNVSMCELTDGTPKRRLQLSLTPTPQSVTPVIRRISSISSFTDSPNHVEDSPTIQQMTSRLQNRNPALRRPLSLRRHQSMPVHFQGFSQEIEGQKENVEEIASGSHGTDQEKKEAEVESHPFRVPNRPPTKRGLHLPVPQCLKKSPTAPGSLEVAAGSSAALPEAPPHIFDVDNDDDFLELLVAEQGQVAEEKVSSSLMSLMNAPLLSSEAEHKSPGETPKGSERGQPRGLFRSPSAPRLTGLKRSECSTQRVSPLNKRRKSVCEDETTIQPIRPPLYRSHSICEVGGFSHYLNAGGEGHNLIGDFSKPYCLPLVKGKHQDLKSITPDTLVDLLQGLYSGQVQHFEIIDCRYPYEYKGGHIKGAKNIYRKDEVLSELLRNPPKYSDSNERHILVFHCEFSSERAPKLSRFLRNKDRDAHKNCYPGLNYPEVYLLDGGYKAFYEAHESMCDPQSYTPMLHKDYGEELKKFRLRSKSWAGERRPVMRAGLTQRFNSVR